MQELQSIKETVVSYYRHLEEATPRTLPSVVKTYNNNSAHKWYGVYPFDTISTLDALIEEFWIPFYTSFKYLQRREDIFIAGQNVIDGKHWTASMGHFLGIFDKTWLGILPTHSPAFLRYAEFNCVEGEKITQTAFFCDIIDLMHQTGLQVLPMQMGASITQPGPRTHDGILHTAQDESETQKTLNLIEKMIQSLGALNESENDECPPEYLEPCWHNTMLWYGPAGIGTTYTIEEFQKKHQYPFRKNLKDKTFNGHVCRFAEGQYGGFFGWPNLTHKTTGGFLGLTGSKTPVDLRVVDMYRREGDKLAENWVFMDMLYWLKQQGLDILERNREIQNT